jgi:hypothetical protein
MTLLPNGLCGLTQYVLHAKSSEIAKLSGIFDDPSQKKCNACHISSQSALSAGGRDWARHSHFDGTNSKPHKLPDCPHGVRMLCWAFYDRVLSSGGYPDL